MSVWSLSNTKKWAIYYIIYIIYGPGFSTAKPSSLLLLNTKLGVWLHVRLNHRVSGIREVTCNLLTREIPFLYRKHKEVFSIDIAYVSLVPLSKIGKRFLSILSIVSIAKDVIKTFHTTLDKPQFFLYKVYTYWLKSNKYMANCSASLR